MSTVNVYYTRFVRGNNHVNGKFSYETKFARRTKNFYKEMWQKLFWAGLGESIDATMNIHSVDIL